MVQRDHSAEVKKKKKVEMPDACKTCKQEQCLQEGCEHIEAYQAYLRNASERL